MNAMSRIAHKYHIEYTNGPGKYTLDLPQESKFLSAQNQHGALVLWFRINTDNPDVTRTFYLLETDKEWPDHYRYLTTVQLQDGNYVLHLLEAA